MIAIHGLVQVAQKADGVEVFLAAEFILFPLAVFAAEIEVEHGGHGVDAQAVDVILVEPEQRTAAEKEAYLVAAIVEDVAVPVGVISAFGIGVRVKIRAVEIGETVLVAREMRGDPVEDHADAVAMQKNNEKQKNQQQTKTHRKNKKTRGLVAPRAVKRM